MKGLGESKESMCRHRPMALGPGSPTFEMV